MEKHKDKTKKKSKDAEPETESAETPVAPVAETPVADEALETRMLRLQADFDNFRKRTQRERGEWYLRANEDLLRELLPVIDHFEMGLQNAAKHHVDHAVIDGFQLVYDQLMQALAKFQLVPFDSEGREFDPHIHEAMTHVPSAEHPADVIIAETRRGYRLGDKLLRPSQVIVSSGPAEPAVPDVPAEEERVD
jgi:molecular chaperone GrpE